MWCVVCCFTNILPPGQPATHHIYPLAAPAFFCCACGSFCVLVLLPLVVAGLCSRLPRGRYIRKATHHTPHLPSGCPCLFLLCLWFLLCSCPFASSGCWAV